MVLQQWKMDQFDDFRCMPLVDSIRWIRFGSAASRPGSPTNLAGSASRLQAEKEQGCEQEEEDRFVMEAGSDPKNSRNSMCSNS